MSDNFSTDASLEPTEKGTLSTFQRIVVAALIVLIIQSLVFTIGAVVLVATFNSEPTDTERVQAMVVSGHPEYLYGSLFDAVSNGTATWNMFDADRGFPVVEVTGTVEPGLQEALAEALNEKGVISGDMSSYDFRVQFVPSYGTGESFIGEFFPSFSSQEITRRWELGFEAFQAVEGGTAYVDVVGHLVESLYRAY